MQARITSSTFSVPLLMCWCLFPGVSVRQTRPRVHTGTTPHAVRPWRLAPSQGSPCYPHPMDALLVQLPTIVAVIGTGIALWRSMSARLDRIEGRMDRHLEWHAQPSGK